MRKEFYKDKKWLLQKYYTEKLSMQRIGNICECDAGLIYRWLKKFNIKTRNYSESVLNIKKTCNPLIARRTYKNKKWLIQKYIKEELATRKIAQCCGISKHAINFWLKRHEIKLRALGPKRGDKNPLWKGGRKAANDRRRKTGDYKKYRIQWLKSHPNYTRDKARKMKIKAIKHKGGKCQKCPIKYNGHNACIFDFHHKDLKVKERSIGALINRSWEKLIIELDKTDLLCSNCHRLIHNGGHK